MSDGQIPLKFKVNGQDAAVRAYPMERLLDVLRRECGLTGTKEGCGEGECGACSVFLDGKLVNSCLVPAAQSQGAEIRTVEGLATPAGLHPVQQGFLECGGAQCGICTPGMVLASVRLLEQNPAPSDEQIREGLAGNLCRCTGYMKIFDSVRRASEILREQKQKPEREQNQKPQREQNQKPQREQNQKPQREQNQKPQREQK